MNDPEGVGLLLEDARRYLDQDSDPHLAFQRLVEHGVDVRAAALATCVALGIPRTEAEQRLALDDEVFWGSGDGRVAALFADAAECAELLRYRGTFDVHLEFDVGQARVAALLAAAISEISPLGSGYANTVGRMIGTGRFTDALVLLSNHRFGRRPSSAEFWRSLVNAAEAMGAVDDPEYLGAVRRCQDQLALQSEPTPRGLDL